MSFVTASKDISPSKKSTRDNYGMVGQKRIMVATPVRISALVAVLAFAGPIYPQDITTGKRLYVAYCSGCHGSSGKGDGPAAKTLAAKPADHTQGAAMNRLGDYHLLKVIAEGGAKVGKSPQMPAWGAVLSEKQIQDIVAYIRTLAVPPYSREENPRTPD